MYNKDYRDHIPQHDVDSLHTFASPEGGAVIHESLDDRAHGQTLQHLTSSGWQGGGPSDAGL